MATAVHLYEHDADNPQRYDPAADLIATSKIVYRRNDERLCKSGMMAPDSDTRQALNKTY